MKTLKEYLFEGIFDTDTDAVPYLYHPKSNYELKNCIKEIIQNHRNDKIIDLNCIDTSKVTDMTLLFSNNLFNKYNFDVSKWDVSNVKYMNGMFQGCIKFNCDLSKWDVKNVKNMSYMFDKCKNFNCNISTWDTTNVTDMSNMFKGCINFNSDLSKWDVQHVNAMNNMFDGCKKFKCDLSKWNPDLILIPFDIFYNCPMGKHPELQPDFK